MPLDALGRTRATMPGTTGVYPSPKGAGNPVKSQLKLRALFAPCVHTLVPSHARMFLWLAWAWGLQLFPTNEECLVLADH